MSAGAGEGVNWLSTAVWILLILIAFVLGYVFGAQSAPSPGETGTAPLRTAPE
jgi:hypothetical protein